MAKSKDIIYAYLFTREGCPSCPAAKELFSGDAIPVELVDCGTEDGQMRARRMGVSSTPTAVFFRGGREMGRSSDLEEIAGFLSHVKRERH